MACIERSYFNEVIILRPRIKGARACCGSIQCKAMLTLSLNSLPFESPTIVPWPPIRDSRRSRWGTWRPQSSVVLVWRPYVLCHCSYQISHSCFMSPLAAPLHWKTLLSDDEKRGQSLWFFFFTTLRIFKILSFTLLLCIKKDGWEGGGNHVFTFFSSLINCFYCLNLKSTRNMFSDSVKSSSSPKHRHLLQEDRKCNCGSVRRYFFFHCNRAPGRRSETERMLDSHGREIRVFRSEERNR